MSTQVQSKASQACVESDDQQCRDVIAQECHHQAGPSLPLLRDVLAVLLALEGVLQRIEYPGTRDKARYQDHTYTERDRAQYNIGNSPILRSCRFGHYGFHGDPRWKCGPGRAGHAA
jgi:hypothetical protein